MADINIPQTDQREMNQYREILNSSNISGGAIRDVAKGLLLLCKDLSAYFQVKAIVIDTNIILKDLSYICKNKRPSRLFGEAEFDFIRPFVTPYIIEEVIEKIPKFCRNVHLDPQEMFAAWEIYKKNLIILQPQQIKSNNRIDRLKMRDADDVPTAELIEIIGPSLALSMDKDLKSFGYAQPGDWLSFVTNTSKIIEKDTLNVVITLGSGVIIIGVAEALKSFVTIIKNMFNRIPKVILGSFILSLSYFLINTQTRKWITDKFKSVINFDRNSVQRVFNDLFTAFQQMAIGWVESEQALKKGEPVYSNPSNLRGYVIRVLAQSHNSLSVEQIMSRVIQLGYRPRGANPQKYLSHLLHKEPIFSQEETGMWNLNIELENGLKTVSY